MDSNAPDDIAEHIARLDPLSDGSLLRRLTHQLVGLQSDPGAELRRFWQTAGRPIPGYDPSLMPSWKRVLVTGGTGCVGTTTLRGLARDHPNAELVSVARRPVSPSHLVPGVRYLCGDVRDEQQISRIMQQCRPDLILHLAAQRDPGLAEHRIAETVSTNVLGTYNVLEAAGVAGAQRVVIASTGKAVRFYTSDVYAATKKVTEYLAVRAARRWATNIACVRFTHVVDNSLIGDKIHRWIDGGTAIQLHSPNIIMPVQSALECYQLLMTAGAIDAEETAGVTLRDLGWPPISLLDLVLDTIAQQPDTGAFVCFTGYPPGYEAFPYPGTYDPLTAGDISCMINSLEADTSRPAAMWGAAVDQFPLLAGGLGAWEAAVDDLLVASRAAISDGEAFLALQRASDALLQLRLHVSGPRKTSRVQQLGRKHDPLVPDHAHIHQAINQYLTAAAKPASVRS